MQRQQSGTPSSLLSHSVYENSNSKSSSSSSSLDSTQSESDFNVIYGNLSKSSNFEMSLIKQWSHPRSQGEDERVRKVASISEGFPAHFKVPPAATETPAALSTPLQSKIGEFRSVHSLTLFTPPSGATSTLPSPKSGASSPYTPSIELHTSMRELGTTAALLWPEAATWYTDEEFYLLGLLPIVFNSSAQAISQSVLISFVLLCGLRSQSYLVFIFLRLRKHKVTMLRGQPIHRDCLPRVIKVRLSTSPAHNSLEPFSLPHL